jgi:hypothetical protein
VTVHGNMSVGDDVITRTLAFKPGNRFSLATDSTEPAPALRARASSSSPP